MVAKRTDSASPSAADGEALAKTSPVGEVAERVPAPARKRPLGSAARRRRSAREPVNLHGAAALIVAHNQARRIAATVRAARAIPGIDLVLVVDDASADNTQELARRAGAVVVRHSHHRGRTASVETGASVIAMRDDPGRRARAVLLLPGGLGQHAIGAAPLVPAVTEHVADLAIALTEIPGTATGASARAARRAIEHASGWVPTEPLGAIRCLTREALEAAIPLAHGGGLEVGMTIDVLRAGLTVTEVECEIRHKPQGGGGRSAPARAA
ncbi:MAG: glycosyltransferase family 2 protein, partial [Demequina sp.]